MRDTHCTRRLGTVIIRKCGVSERHALHWKARDVIRQDLLYVSYMERP